MFLTINIYRTVESLISVELLVFFVCFFLINFWPHWVFSALFRLSRVVESRGYCLQLRCTGFSCCRAWALGHLHPAVVVPRLQGTGSVVEVQRLSCFMACGIFPDHNEACVPYTGTTCKVHCWCFQVPDTESPDAQTDGVWNDTYRLPCSDTESEPGQASKAAPLNQGQCLETSVVLTLGVGRVRSAPGKQWGSQGCCQTPTTWGYLREPEELKLKTPPLR